MQEDTSSDAQLEQHVTDVIAGFTNSILRIREAAFKEAALLQPNRQVCQALETAIGNERDPQLLQLMMKAIEIHGPQDPETACRLVDPFLFDTAQNMFVRISALSAFAACGGDRHKAFAAALVSLRANDLTIRLQALGILLRTAPSETMFHLLMDIFRDEQEMEDVRCHALRHLKESGVQARVVSRRLAEALSTSSVQVLLEVIFTLEDIGVSADAVPALIAALNYTRPGTHIICNRYPGLFGMGVDMHQLVVRQLGMLGTDAQAAIPALEELLTRDTNEREALEKLAFRQEARRLPRTRGRPPKVIEEARMQPLNDQLRLTSKDAQDAAREAIARIRGIAIVQTT